MRAIYDRSRLVVGVFSFLWLVNLGCYTLTFLLVDGINIGPTKHCTFGDPNITFVATCAISAFVFDTAVFVAISARLYTAHNVTINGVRTGQSDFAADARRFVSGSNLPRLSRTLLKDGQAYLGLLPDRIGSDSDGIRSDGEFLKLNPHRRMVSVGLPDDPTDLA